MSRVTSKRRDNLKGELKIIDTYCGERTLDILRDVRKKHIKFSTEVNNLQGKIKIKV